jgi:gliding motility-associated-like protein
MARRILEILGVFLFMASSFLAAQESIFGCDNDFYFFSNRNLYAINLNAEIGLMTLDTISSTLFSGRMVNAIGFSFERQSIFGIDQNEFPISKIVEVDEFGGVVREQAFSRDFEHFGRIVAGTFSLVKDEFYALRNSRRLNNQVVIFPELFVFRFENNTILVDSLNLTPLNGANEIAIKDFVMNPLDGLLYGFDFATSRMVSIDPESGVLNNTDFSQLSELNERPDFDAFKFTAFGEMLGISLDGRQRGISFNLQDNAVDALYDFSITTRNNGNQDGFSCPYTIGLRQAARKDTVVSCVPFEVDLVLGVISDGSNRLVLRDTFPAGFELLEVVENPFGGTVSGLGTNTLQIEGMDAPNGFDTIRLSVVATEVVLPGPYLFQASLRDANQSASGYNFNVIRSDYLPTPAEEDPSPVFVQALAEEQPVTDFQLCAGQSLELDPFSARLDSLLDFSWSTGSISSSIDVRESGEYRLLVSNACITDTLDFLVEAGDVLVDLGDDVTLRLGERLALDPRIFSTANITSIRWITQDTSILSCIDCPITTVIPQGLVSTVRVVVVSEFGCVATDSVTISLDRALYVPTAFSPNGDGVNDCFFLQNGAPVEVESLLIFDRWGGLTHRSTGGTTNSCTGGWDGTVNGRNAEVGLYAWVAVLRYSDGSKEERSGLVTLLR